MHVELQPEEAELLKRVLEGYLSDLRYEIVDTDNASYRADLRSEKEMLEAIVSRIPGLQEGVVPS